MVRRLLPLLLFALLLCASSAAAQTVGYITRLDCTTEADPVPYEVICLNTGDGGSLSQGKLYLWDGADWVEVVDSTIPTIDEQFDADSSPVITGATEAKPFTICGNDTDYCVVIRVTSSNSPEVVGKCAGTVGGCDRNLPHNAGKGTTFSDSDGNVEVQYTEDVGFSKLTIDTEAQGNILVRTASRWSATMFTEKKWFEVAACQAGTASLIWNSPTSNAPAATCDATDTVLGTADFDASTDESIEISYKLPSDWTGDIDVNFIWKAAATSGNVGWCLQIARTPDAATSSTSFAAQGAGNCVSDAAKGTTLQENIASITAVTCTSCAAGDRLKLRVSRDANGGAVTDSMTGDAKLIGIELTYRRTLQ